MSAKTPQNSFSFEDLLAGVESFPKTNEPFPLVSHVITFSNSSCKPIELYTDDFDILILDD